MLEWFLKCTTGCFDKARDGGHFATDLLIHGSVAVSPVEPGVASSLQPGAWLRAASLLPSGLNERSVNGASPPIDLISLADFTSQRVSRPFPRSPGERLLEARMAPSGLQASD